MYIIDIVRLVGIKMVSDNKYRLRMVSMFLFNTKIPPTKD